MTRCKEFDRAATLRNYGVRLYLHAPAQELEYISASAVPVNGVDLTLLNGGWLKSTHGVTFTVSSGLDAVLRLVGYNQFGGRVEETITFAVAGATSIQSLNCFERIVSITPVSGTWAAITLQVGFNPNLGGNGPRIALPFVPAIGEIVGYFIGGATFNAAPLIDYERASIRVTGWTTYTTGRRGWLSVVLVPGAHDRH